jgi:OPA family glycerol-3-phosphate transporter-like MFS transporter
MGLFNDWHAAFYVPAAVALGVAVFAFITMRDTPQSVGLPPIEQYKNDYPEGYDASHEDEFSAKEIFVKYVLRNKMLWYMLWPTFSSTCCATACWTGRRRT